MFSKILIANRGEIACRVMATAARLGVATVAVFSEADRTARHVDLADEAWPIGPAAAARSYLDGARIIEAARRSGAEAIHPGYGFLSENADFAEACAAVGIVFIGPPPAAIRAMGSKSAAKALMAASGVPLVPGYHGGAQDGATLAAEAARVGYPVLIKASAGGGGKGMRVVEGPGDLAEAIAAAKREAASAFGDDRILVERYLTRPRHIEIQVFADWYGNVVSLFERDCSIQRRHQKVVEEAPAPGMDPARRRLMGETAVAAARAVGYVGAGTVEFIAEGDGFHFMEMNTRLQVEHPVTEMITGQDLVEWQLRVAAGEPLPWTQEQLAIRGHAIEVRVYAEDPARNFLPQTGTLVHLRQPAASSSVRVDTGVREGDRITPYYDPMIAKLIAWGEDRDAACRRLGEALHSYEIAGVETNLPLLRAIVDHPAFREGAFDTGFIGRHASVLLAGTSDEATASPADEAMIWAAACLSFLAGEGASPASSPWALADGWRLNGAGFQRLQLRWGSREVTITAYPQLEGGFRLDLPSGPVVATLVADSAAATGGSARPAMRLSVDGVLRRLTVVRQDRVATVILGGTNYPVAWIDPLQPPHQDAAGSDRVAAPIPARVTRVLVAPGSVVEKGAVLVVLEAMKTELTLSAPASGTVATVGAAEGEMVEEGTVLVTFEL